MFIKNSLYRPGYGPNEENISSPSCSIYLSVKRQKRQKQRSDYWVNMGLRPYLADRLAIAGVRDMGELFDISYKQLSRIYMIGPSAIKEMSEVL